MKRAISPARLAVLFSSLAIGAASTATSLAADDDATAGANTDSGKSPLSIWEGQRESYLRGTFKVEAAYFTQGNPWFGEDVANIGADTGSWWETVIHPGIQGSYHFEENGEVYGRFSFVNANTQDIDAAGSNADLGDVGHTAVEDAYLGWRSGDLFSSLGEDFLDISFGMQEYEVGTGFLFYAESGNGGNRGDYWIGERKSAQYAGIVKINYGRLKTDLVYFKANDNPDTDTKVGGITVDYDLGDFGGLGGGYYHVDSDIVTRDGMDVYDVRFQTTPFKAFDTADVLKPIKFDGEYAYEDNGSKLAASGWYLSAGYDWDKVAWKPGLTYRYASFQGNNPNSSKSQDFDPLFYGFNDWGYWYQGEILGEYVLANSNLNSHMIRLSVDPLDTLHINLFYYNFKLDNAAGFGVQSKDFADEWDLTVDWTPNDSLTFSLVAAYAKPDNGAKQYTGGDEDWSYLMLYASYNLD